jgi:hypothetical protein
MTSPIDDEDRRIETSVAPCRDRPKPEFAHVEALSRSISASYEGHHGGWI